MEDENRGREEVREIKGPTLPSPNVSLSSNTEQVGLLNI
jgi:hypothetical protein